MARHFNNPVADPIREIIRLKESLTKGNVTSVNGMTGDVVIPTSSVTVTLVSEGIYAITVPDAPGTSSNPPSGGDVPVAPPVTDPEPTTPEVDYDYDSSDADVSFEHVLSEPLTLRYVDSSGDGLDGVPEIGTTTVS